MNKRIKYKIDRYKKYEEQIKDLEEERKVLLGLQRELLEEAKEFFPLNVLDIILFKGKIYRVMCLNNVSLDGEIKFRVQVEYPHNEEWREKGWSIILTMDNYKLLHVEK